MASQLGSKPGQCDAKTHYYTGSVVSHLFSWLTIHLAINTRDSLTGHWKTLRKVEFFFSLLGNKMAEEKTKSDAEIKTFFIYNKIPFAP